MNEASSNDKNNEYINFTELTNLIWRSKFLYLLTIGVFFLLANLYVNTLTPIYKSSALVKPADSNSISSNGNSQLNILASVIGGRNSAEINKTTLALQMMSSRAFFLSFYNDDSLMLDLHAFVEYSPLDNQNIYDKNLINKENKLINLPEIDSSHGKFLSHLEFIRDEAGFITIIINHPSPIIAYKWNNWIFNALDQYIRDREKIKSEKSIQFLERKINDVKNIELQRGLSNMIQSQLGTLLLAEVSDNFVFEIIDGPYVPSAPFKPNRSFIVNIILLSSVMFLTFLIITLYYFGILINLSLRPLRLSFDKS